MVIDDFVDDTYLGTASPYGARHDNANVSPLGYPTPL